MAVSPLEEALSVLDRGEEAHKRLDIVTAMDYYKRFKTLMVKVFYIPGLAEHADRWGNRINKYISMFEIVISRHKQRAAPSSNPSQVGAISQGPNVHLEDLTPPERAALEYLEPSAFDRFSLAQMCYISAVTSLEQNDKATAFHFFREAAENFNRCLKFPEDPSNKQIRAQALHKVKLSISSAQALQKSLRDAPLTLGKHFTESEKAVLAASSSLHGFTFYPWCPADEIRPSSGPPFFEEPSQLRLTQKQERAHPVWLRPRDIVDVSEDKIAIFGALSPASITQTVVGDCSLLSSLSVLALMERTHGLRLLTGLIYPQNAAGTALYNPAGLYHVRLFFNGTWRKVAIDDRLPCASSPSSRPRRLLCSYSAERNELWVSLLEKAYLKVRGSGYDFPGSLSEVDIQFLAGWIPERWDMHRDSTSKEDKWKRIAEGIKLGMCVLTVSTGSLSEAEEEATGLLRNHAYALLGVKEACGVRLLQLKNPWGSNRWKGNYSVSDTASWTAELQAAVGYSLAKAAQDDDGIFYIDFDSLCQYYELVHFSWSPELFPFKTQLHILWPASSLFSSSALRTQHAPQFIVRKAKRQTLWFLLHRHFESERAPGSELKRDAEDDDEDISVALRICRHVPRASAGAGTGADGLCGTSSSSASLASTSSEGSESCGAGQPHIRRLHRFPSVGTVVYQPSHYVLQKVQDDFEGYLSVGVSLYELPARLRDIRFTLFVYSSTPIQLMAAEPQHPAECVESGVWMVSPFFQNGAKAEFSGAVPAAAAKQTVNGLVIRHSAPLIHPSKPPPQPLSRVQPPLLTKPDILSNPKLLRVAPFVHATQTLFAPQYLLQLSPNPETLKASAPTVFEGDGSFTDTEKKAPAEPMDPEARRQMVPDYSDQVVLWVESVCHPSFFLDVFDCTGCRLAPPGTPIGTNKTSFATPFGSTSSSSFSSAPSGTSPPSAVFPFRTTQLCKERRYPQQEHALFTFDGPAQVGSGGGRVYRVSVPTTTDTLADYSSFMLHAVPPSGFSAELVRLPAPWTLYAHQLCFSGEFAALGDERPEQAMRFVLQAKAATDVYIQLVAVTTKGVANFTIDFSVHTAAPLLVGKVQEATDPQCRALLTALGNIPPGGLAPETLLFRAYPPTLQVVRHSIPDSAATLASKKDESLSRRCIALPTAAGRLVPKPGLGRFVLDVQASVDEAVRLFGFIWSNEAPLDMFAFQ